MTDDWAEKPLAELTFEELIESVALLKLQHIKTLQRGDDAIANLLETTALLKIEHLKNIQKTDKVMAELIVRMRKLEEG